MKIDIGTLRDCLSLDLQRQCEDIIDQKKHDPNYYILVWSDTDPLDPNRVKTKIFTMYKDMLPSTPLIGTMCVYVDNKAGRIKSLWNLPLDIPTEGITDPDNTEKEAGEWGEKMGWAIFNN